MKRTTSTQSYMPKQWTLNKSWLADRAKFLIMLERYNFNSAFDNSLLDELQMLRMIFPEIYGNAFEEFVEDGITIY